MGPSLFDLILTYITSPPIPLLATALPLPHSPFLPSPIFTPRFCLATWLPYHTAIIRARRSLGFCPKVGCLGLKSWVWVLGNARAAQGVLKMKFQPGASFSARRVAKITILGCPATLREPCGKGKTYFTNLLAKIKNRMEFLHLGRALFIFCPLIYF